MESGGRGNDAGVADLRHQVAKRIDERKLLVKRQKVLVGVSGGLDSMVLLHLLADISRTTGWRLGVVHLNHGLRSRASGHDARFVAREAERRGVPFFGERKDVGAIAATTGVSVEMAARQARHQTFADVAVKWRCRSVSLAHHRDDQLELFFLRLFRGAGSQGLGGMSAAGPSPTDRRLRLVRPLLDLGRTELAAYAAENRIRFREDPSNLDESILRNRIRHRLVPLLINEFQPALGEMVVRAMEILRDEHAFLEGRLDFTGSFDAQPIAVRRAVVRRGMIEIGIPPGFELIERLLREPGRAVTGPNGQGLVLSPDGRIAPADLALEGFRAEECEITLGDRVIKGSFAGLAYSARQVAKSIKTVVDKSPADSEMFDADAVGGVVRLRHWRPGDRFRPIGMKADVKLQNLFVNAKISRNERRKRVLAENGEGAIFWVEGLRIGEIAKLRSSTRRILCWRWRRA